jgi:hypothetical protein
MEKKYKTISIILGLIAIVLGICIIVISLNDKEKTCEDRICDCTNNVMKCDEKELNIDKLYEVSKSTYNFIKTEDIRYGENKTISFKLDLNGTINISFENNISNITNAKNIESINNFSKNYLYILTEDGYVYEYDIDEYENGNYAAKKIEKYSNIKQILKYVTRRAGAGGCDYIIAVDNNDNYEVLNNNCV